MAVDRKNGKLAGFLNGIATNEYSFRDEFFTDASTYDPEGRNIMLCGLDVLPEYRKQGLARELIFNYCRREQERGTKRLVLTCHADKVKMYQKFGFRDLGESASEWGGEKWHEMDIILQSEGLLEIERKFLIRYPDPELLERICSQKADIIQTYLDSGKNRNISRRVRKVESGEKTVYWYNEKVKLSDTTRIEHEWEISEQEYLKLLMETIPGSGSIIKTRYFLPSGDHCFEIDIFPEWNDRAFAEVELGNEDEEYLFPECLTLIKEVTEDRRYTNKSLALNGFVYDEI